MADPGQYRGWDLGQPGPATTNRDEMERKGWGRGQLCQQAAPSAGSSRDVIVTELSSSLSLSLWIGIVLELVSPEPLRDWGWCCAGRGRVLGSDISLVRAASPATPSPEQPISHHNHRYSLARLYTHQHYTAVNSGH